MSKCKRLLAALKFSEEQINTWESQSDEITDEQITQFANSAPIFQDVHNAAQNDADFIRKIGAEKYGQILNMQRKQAQEFGIDPTLLEEADHKTILKLYSDKAKELIEKEGGTSKKQLHEFQEKIAGLEGQINEWQAYKQSVETELIPKAKQEAQFQYRTESAFSDIVRKLKAEDKITGGVELLNQVALHKAREKYDFDINESGLSFLTKGEKTLPYEGTKLITPESFVYELAEQNGLIKKANTTPTQPTTQTPNEPQTPTKKGFGYKPHPNFKSSL